MKKHKQQTITELLREHGFKATPGRLALLTLLMQSQEPLTVEDMTHKLSQKINTATIYRALDQFVQKGMLYQTHFRDGKTYYEYQQQHHHHIVCTNCGDKEEVSVCFDSMTSTVQKSSKKFTEIKDHILEFFGTCKKCTM